ncbi:type 1 fimbrial protein [Burkholderia sp. Bp9143]|nr:type 1 fimbrial protein [Burkholderia sp. Bp9143]
MEVYGYVSHCLRRASHRYTRFAVLSALMLTSCFPLVARAALDYCSPMGVGTATKNIYNLSGYNSHIDPDVPVGTTLHSQTSLLNGDSLHFECMYVPGGIQSVMHGRLEPVGAYNTWPSSVPGIGIRMRELDVSSWWPIYDDLGNSARMISFLPKTMLIEFVKTGNIDLNGGVIQGEIGGIWLRKNTQQVVSIRILGGIQIRPKPPVCTVTTKSITVPFGQIQFPSNVGSVTLARPFDITVKCTGSAHGGVSNVYMTMTDVQKPSNRGDQLALDPKGGATGVAVQILNNGTPVKFGADSNAPGNTNQWFVRQTGDGTFNIPLSARYIRTAAQMQPGVANAAATFTMSYQ